MLKFLEAKHLGVKKTLISGEIAIKNSLQTFPVNFSTMVGNLIGLVGESEEEISWPASSNKENTRRKPTVP